MNNNKRLLERFYPENVNAVIVFPVPDFEHMTKEGAQKRTMFKAWCLGEDAKVRACSVGLFMKGRGRSSLLSKPRKDRNT